MTNTRQPGQSASWGLFVLSPAAEAFVTLATTDSYCMGAAVVARSLRRHGTTRHIVAMITPNVSEQSRWENDEPCVKR